MSDFVAVLKRTLQGLGETTPETRQRVYDKARSTIMAKLEAMNPPANPALVSRQRRALEDAIAEVESGYRPASAPREPLDELEQVLNSLSGLKDQPQPAKAQTPARPVEAPRPAAAAAPAPRPVTTPTARPVGPAAPPMPRPAAAAPQERKPAPPPPPPADDMDDLDNRADDLAEPPVESRIDGNRRGRLAGVVIAAVILAALAAGGYAGWMNRDRIAQVAAEWMPSQTEAPAASETPAPETPASSEPAPASPADNTQEQTEQPAPEAPAPEAPPNGPVKFTQKLNADGTESDAGPSPSGPSVGEGTSVAAANQQSSTPPAQTPPQTPATPDGQVAQPAAPGNQPADGTPAAPEGTPAPTPPDSATPTPATPDPVQSGQPPAQTPPAQPAPGQAGVAVAQKAIFYEERTSNAAGSAEPGSIVWSMVQESPGADLPPEPAIRAEATIPSKDIQLRMTIRRNADKTLPASHIIELIFITPPNFDGGGVSSVVRVALKGSEQDPGAPLAGLPAKISDGFFLFALNDGQADQTQNMRMLQDRSWLDIPLVYNSGRRALITMEKGIPGDKVFTDVLKAWGVPNSG